MLGSRHKNGAFQNNTLLNRQKGREHTYPAAMIRAEATRTTMTLRPRIESQCKEAAFPTEGPDEAQTLAIILSNRLAPGEAGISQISIRSASQRRLQAGQAYT